MEVPYGGLSGYEAFAAAPLRHEGHAETSACMNNGVRGLDVIGFTMTGPCRAMSLARLRGVGLAHRTAPPSAAKRSFTHARSGHAGCGECRTR